MNGITRFTVLPTYTIPLSEFVRFDITVFIGLHTQMQGLAWQGMCLEKAVAIIIVKNWNKGII